MESPSTTTAQPATWGERHIPEIVTFLLTSAEIPADRRTKVAQAFKAHLARALEANATIRVFVSRDLQGKIDGLGWMETADAKDSSNAVISDVVIRRDCRESGVDGRIFEWAESAARDAKARRLIIGKGAQLGHPKRYFENRGFKVFLGAVAKILV